MKKILIAAISNNNVLGKEGGLVWDMPADRDFLINVIKDQVLIMGRKSYEENVETDFFPGSKHIIITRNENYKTDHIVVNNVIQAYEIASKFVVDKVYVLGGGRIYEQTISDADELVITHIDAEFEGDTFFPKIDDRIWRVASRESHEADELNPYPYTFTIYLRK